MTDCIIGNAVAAIERTQAATPGRSVIHDCITNDVGITPVDNETAATCDRCVLHNPVGLNYALLTSMYTNTSAVVQSRIIVHRIIGNDGRASHGIDATTVLCSVVPKCITRDC